MAEREGEMVNQVIARPVPLVEDSPRLLDSLAALDVLIRDAGSMANRRGNAEPLRQGARLPAGWGPAEAATSSWSWRLLDLSWPWPRIPYVSRKASIP